MSLDLHCFFVAQVHEHTIVKIWSLALRDDTICEQRGNIGLGPCLYSPNLFVSCELEKLTILGP